MQGKDEMKTSINKTIEKTYPKLMVNKEETNIFMMSNCNRGMIIHSTTKDLIGTIVSFVDNNNLHNWEGSITILS